MRIVPTVAGIVMIVVVWWLLAGAGMHWFMQQLMDGYNSLGG